jgi:hypothetical protein
MASHKLDMQSFKGFIEFVAENLESWIREATVRTRMPSRRDGDTHSRGRYRAITSSLSI